MLCLLWNGHLSLLLLATTTKTKSYYQCQLTALQAMIHHSKPVLYIINHPGIYLNLSLFAWTYVFLELSPRAISRNILKKLHQTVNSIAQNKEGILPVLSTALYVLCRFISSSVVVPEVTILSLAL